SARSSFATASFAHAEGDSCRPEGQLRIGTARHRPKRTRKRESAKARSGTGTGDASAEPLSIRCRAFARRVPACGTFRVLFGPFRFAESQFTGVVPQGRRVLESSNLPVPLLSSGCRVGDGPGA